MITGKGASVTLNTCGVCNNEAVMEAFRFENMSSVAQNLPDKDSLSSDYGITLDLCVCPYCGVAFLDAEPVEYYREVIRAVGVSEEIKSAKHKQFREFCEKYDLSDKRIIEIGCGDGSFLEILACHASKAFGIEFSADSVSKCQDRGLSVFQGFISGDDYRICEERYDGFMLLMFLEHIPQPRAFLKGIYNNLNDDAVGLIEVPDSEMVFSNGLYAEIMRDHLYYFDKRSLTALVSSCGFEVIEHNTIRDGYVLSLTVRKKRIDQLSGIGDYIEKVKSSFNGVFGKYKEIAVWGASHQTFFLLSQIGDTSKISYIIDSAEFKQGKYSPVSHIPICEYGDDMQCGAVIVSAGSYNAEIVDILRKKHGYAGDVYVFEIDTLRIV